MKPTVIFDTSALNAIADEHNSEAILRSFGIGYYPRITETNLAEILATKCPERRTELLQLCRHLLSGGECIKPYHWIIDELIKLHAHHSDIFNWKRPDLRSRAIEEELTRPQFINDETVSEQIRLDFRAVGRAFEKLFRDARTQVPVDEEALGKLSLVEMVRLSEAEGSPHWVLAADIYALSAGKRPSEQEVRAFIGICPPFGMLMLMTCLAQYHRCVRDIKAPALYDAGRLDLMMSVFVPYCDRFVTNDAGQYNALTAIAGAAAVTTEIQSYEQFRKGWLLSPVLS